VGPKHAAYVDKSNKNLLKICRDWQLHLWQFWYDKPQRNFR